MRLFIIMFFMCVGVQAATFKNIGQLATQLMTQTSTADLIPIFSATGAITRKITMSELDKRFFNANFTTEATFADKLTVDATAFFKSRIILKSPDTTCSSCSVDNADTFTCTSIACP